jgi:hypothetical protein
MRALLIPFSALVIMAAQTQAIEWDTFISANPVPASALVSFSIGYPKGWTVCEIPGIQHQDLGPLYDSPPEWIFGGSGPTNLQNFTVTIWRSDDATAEETPEEFLADMRKLHGNGRAFKTSAGDSGWLVESKDYLVCHLPWLSNDPSWPLSRNILSDLPQMQQSRQPSIKVPVIFDSFFFRSESPGNKAGIQIQIMTNAADSSRRAELEQLVLQTLRFNNN